MGGHALVAMNGLWKTVESIQTFTKTYFASSLELFLKNGHKPIQQI